MKTYIYSMKPLNVEGRTVRRIGPEALAIEMGGAVVVRVAWRWWRRRLFLFSGLCRSRASTIGPGIDGINSRTQIRLLYLLIGPWSHGCCEGARPNTARRMMGACNEIP